MQTDKLNLKDIVEILLKLIGYYTVFSSGMGMIYFLLSMAAISHQGYFETQNMGQFIFGILFGLALIKFSEKLSSTIVGDKSEKVTNPIEVEKTVLIMGLLILWLANISEIFTHISFYLMNPADGMAQRQAQMESIMSGEPIKAIKSAKSSLPIIFSVIKLIIYSFLLYQSKAILSFFFDKTKAPSKPIKYVEKNF